MLLRLRDILAPPAERHPDLQTAGDAAGRTRSSVGVPSLGPRKHAGAGEVSDGGGGGGGGGEGGVIFGDAASFPAIQDSGFQSMV